MATIVAPLQFSTAYNVKPEKLKLLGVLDPTLNVDTKLFVDPLLLSVSSHREIRRARATYESRFSQVIEFLNRSHGKGDVAWRSAERLLTFPEISWTCLGYGAATIRGSAFGPVLRSKLMTTAKEIVDLGVTSPDLFTAMALFEENIGPDRLSDLTTRVILHDLISFNRRILKRLNITPTQYSYSEGESFGLASNPKLNNQPVVLLPIDILRALPIAFDWDGVVAATRHNDALRERVNRDIGDIWALKTRTDKAKIKQAAMKDRRSFEAFVAMLEEPEKRSYDADRDPEGELFWRKYLSLLHKKEPLRLELLGTPTIDKVIAIVEKIIEHYRHLIEDRRYSRDLYRESGSPRPEKAAQRFFFAVADCYCRANEIDVTPEADTGSGVVDFKFSVGYSRRVMVEIKLSTNSKLVSGFENQITAYSAAESAAASLLTLDTWAARINNYRRLETTGHLRRRFDRGYISSTASCARRRAGGKLAR